VHGGPERAQAAGLRLVDRVSAARDLPLVPAGLGAEWVRAPRLPIAGAERRQVLRIIRDSLAQRPKLLARR